jgi:peptide-methionine (S)-S-oxide reductase
MAATSRVGFGLMSNLPAASCSHVPACGADGLSPLSTRPPITHDRQGTEERLLGRATFSGGCWWCLQPPFDALAGVVATTVGYTGGRKTHPTHDEVVTGRTGHALAVQVLYDLRAIRYSQLLDVFWRNSDPTTPNRQFCAIGAQYRSAIFYHDEMQKHLAEASKQAVEQSQRFTGRIATRIVPLMVFYVAEASYQHASRKPPLHSRHFQSVCDRAQRLQELWGERTQLKVEKQESRDC